MPAKIHHGAPGAYKTSGAVWDDLVPWAESGRVVVTNVRGIEDTDDFINNYMKVFGKKAKVIPDEFEIIYIDTETTEGRKKMQLWFQWSPKGCGFLIDEIQTIYPQKMTPAEYKKLTYASLEEAKAADRPEDVYIAFEKHRHYNWDFVVTAPSIKKIPAIIRDIAEVAYYHNNKGKIGIRGVYLEAMHHPDDSGRLESQWIAHKIKRAPKRAFGLYGSTSTGIAKDTEAGQNIFVQPKMIFMYVLFAATVVWLISRGNPVKFNDDKRGQVQPDGEVMAVSATVGEPELQAAVIKTAEQKNIEIIKLRERRKANAGKLDEYDLFIGGQIFERFVAADLEGVITDFSETQLVSLGYRIKELNRCMWILKHKSGERVIGCQGGEKIVRRSPVVGPAERFKEAIGQH